MTEQHYLACAKKNAQNLASQMWLLVGAIEGINGVLLLGWTIAFLVTVVAKLPK